MRQRLSLAMVYALCLGFWLVLSGHFDPLMLTLGAGSAAGVTWLNRDVEAVSALLRSGGRLLLYLPWLLKEIILANLQVAWIVLQPRLPIDPVVIHYTAPLSTDLGLTTFGNSITLTPGTITLDVEGSDLVVHALTLKGAEALRRGPMASRVARVFREPGR